MKFRIHRAEHVATAARTAQLPSADPNWLEVALLGRSNVGKSSLLNKLVRRKQLARTSSTPGKTRLIHVYEVDLGYAKVARTERQSWQPMIEGYLAGRESLRAAVLLQDLRRDVSDDETLLLDWLDEQAVASLVAITKVDKLKPMRRAKRLRELKAQLPIVPARVVPTSAETGEGMDALWTAIRQRLQDDPAGAAD